MLYFKFTSTHHIIFQIICIYSQYGIFQVQKQACFAVWEQLLPDTAPPIGKFSLVGQIAGIFVGKQMSPSQDKYFFFRITI